jgi:hypothetical protein
MNDLLTVKAPFDGIVSQRFVSVGQHLPENAKTMEFIGNDGMFLLVPIMNKDIAQVSTDSIVMFDSRHGKMCLSVDSILPEIDSESMMLNLLVWLPKQSWIVNETARVRVDSSNVKNMCSKYIDTSSS